MGQLIKILISKRSWHNKCHLNRAHLEWIIKVIYSCLSAAPVSLPAKWRSPFARDPAAGTTLVPGKKYPKAAPGTNNLSSAPRGSSLWVRESA